MTTLPNGSALSEVVRSAADDLLGAEPAVLTGALVGCARVSTREQRLDRQTRALRRAEGLSRYPGYHEVTFGGAVDVGESYQAAVAREVTEELGVDVPAHEVVKFLCHGEIGSYWLGVHEAVITPDGQEAFRRYLEARAASPGSVR
ncbi:NUDIX domain-containing protein [Nonomuraea sp. NPDC046802]|uniref:NUDIX domain-containing protein n=1 Tax=Nonomuraea sp. NPDC046802 TaxID=3154919 RepID=UPI0033D5CE14